MEDVFRFTLAEELEMGLRLTLALVFGAVVGWEREHAQKPAGLRTLALVSLGAAAFSLVSVFGFDDPNTARVAAGIVTGIGFLGAGAIFRSGDTVVGLTTAASIWAIAAVGMLVGAGMYALSGVATVLLLIALRILPKVR